MPPKRRVPRRVSRNRQTLNREEPEPHTAEVSAHSSAGVKEEATQLRDVNNNVLDAALVDAWSAMPSALAGAPTAVYTATVSVQHTFAERYGPGGWDKIPLTVRVEAGVSLPYDVAAAPSAAAIPAQAVNAALGAIAREALKLEAALAAQLSHEMFPELFDVR